jgi:hypothetical protein
MAQNQMKKLAIIGRGTAGCLALAHFYRWTDWEIDLYYDPKIPQQAVGEGSALHLPRNLFESLNFSHTDLYKIDGSFKEGIKKSNWGAGNTFVHTFPPPYISYHFNAVKLQDYILNELNKNKRIKLIEKNIDADKIDADYIFDCSGRPSDYSDFHELNSIPVNAVHVTQCFWDHIRFQHTLTIARPYGWVFGIPLQNRCSIGYMYNHKINTLDEVKEDVKHIFKEYNLTPSDTTNSFHFNNYYRKQNFDRRIAYSGNASFFLEPMEATSISTMNEIQRFAFDIWENDVPVEHSNFKFNQYLKATEQMIMTHYYAGSIFDTPFWKMAKRRGEIIMQEAMQEGVYPEIIKYVNGKLTEEDFHHDFEYGTWTLLSYKTNLKQLGIEKKLLKLYSM